MTLAVLSDVGNMMLTVFGTPFLIGILIIGMMVLMLSLARANVAVVLSIILPLVAAFAIPGSQFVLVSLVAVVLLIAAVGVVMALFFFGFFQ